MFQKCFLIINICRNKIVQMSYLMLWELKLKIEKTNFNLVPNSVISKYFFWLSCIWKKKIKIFTKHFAFKIFTKYFLVSWFLHLYSPMCVWKRCGRHQDRFDRSRDRCSWVTWSPFFFCEVAKNDHRCIAELRISHV